MNVKGQNETAANLRKQGRLFFYSFRIEGVSLKGGFFVYPFPATAILGNADTVCFAEV